MAQRDMLEEWNCEKSHDEHYSCFINPDRQHVIHIMATFQALIRMAGGRINAASASN